MSKIKAWGVNFPPTLILIILAIFIVPLAGVLNNVTQPVWYYQYIGLLFCIFCGISVALWKFNKWLAALTFYCAFSTFFVCRLSPRSIILLFNLDLMCLASYFISTLNKEHRKIILWSILVLTILQSLWLILQIFNKDPIFHLIKNPKMNGLVGFSGSANQCGSFFALVTPVLLSFSPYLIIIPIFGLIVTKSSFAFFAMLIGALLYYKFIDIKKFRFMSLLIMTLAISFMLAQDMPKIADYEPRFGVWNHSVQSTIKGEIFIQKNGQNAMVVTNPLLGYGFGNFLTIFPYVPYETSLKYFKGKYQFNYVDEKFTHAHNDFVEYFFELGWIGLLIMLGLVFDFIRKFIKSNKTPEMIIYFSGIVIYLLNSTGNFLSQIAVSGLFIILYYGFYEATRRENGTIAAKC